MHIIIFYTRRVYYLQFCSWNLEHIYHVERHLHGQNKTKKSFIPNIEYRLSGTLLQLLFYFLPQSICIARVGDDNGIVGEIGCCCFFFQLFVLVEMWAVAIKHMFFVLVKFRLAIF